MDVGGLRLLQGEGSQGVREVFGFVVIVVIFIVILIAWVVFAVGQFVSYPAWHTRWPSDPSPSALVNISLSAYCQCRCSCARPGETIIASVKGDT